MWAQAVRYLKSKLVLDMSALLQTFAAQERDHCKLLGALTYADSDKDKDQDRNEDRNSSAARLKHFDIAVAAGEFVSSIAQNVYDKRCGLVNC